MTVKKTVYATCSIYTTFLKGCVCKSDITQFFYFLYHTPIHIHAYANKHIYMHIYICNLYGHPYVSSKFKV